jgi:peptidoglycan/xylan/chitin deacetylase (PgdA/CDA1 family)
MRWVQRLGVSFLATAMAAPSAAGASERQPIQYVVISFDGAREIEQWHRSRNLAREAGASFTYFLSCVYLLTGENKQRYDPPGHKPGRSNVGFASSRDDVARRLRQIWAARLEGHEIANHGCGHFDGGGWSQKQWRAEFNQFTQIVREAWSANDIPFEPAGWQHFADSEIKGFRAPYLSVGPSLAAALADRRFTYDASSVSRDPEAPAHHEGVAMYSLPLIPEGPEARRVLAMDYNLYVRHSAALERPSQSALFEERAYAAFRAAFEHQYEGGRVPLQLGFHFRLMNAGAYWRALERFAKETCRLLDVRCVTYRELTTVLAGQQKDGQSATAHPAQATD